jgi:hypothetical protein
MICPQFLTTFDSKFFNIAYTDTASGELTVKLSLGLINLAQSHEDSEESGGIAAPILTLALDTGDRLVSLSL